MPRVYRDRRPEPSRNSRYHDGRSLRGNQNMATRANARKSTATTQSEKNSGRRDDTATAQAPSVKAIPRYSQANPIVLPNPRRTVIHPFHRPEYASTPMITSMGPNSAAKTFIGSRGSVGTSTLSGTPLSHPRGSVDSVNADPADQRKLLDLADLDARIRRDEHVKGNPPQAAKVRELIAQRSSLTQELGNRANVRDDLKAELARVESDVAVVDARVKRDAERLAAATNAKQAQGFEAELASLARRKSDLEDAEIALMEQLEAADAAVAEQEALIAETNAQGAELSAEAKRVVAEATDRLGAARRDRDAVAGAVPSDLLALYERLAARGNGAGLLRAGACEACRMVLPPSDLAEVRRAQTDEVVFCPECGAILVRTEESR